MPKTVMFPKSPNIYWQIAKFKLRALLTASLSARNIKKLSVKMEQFRLPHSGDGIGVEVTQPPLRLLRQPDRKQAVFR